MLSNHGFAKQGLVFNIIMALQLTTKATFSIVRVQSRSVDRSCSCITKILRLRRHTCTCAHYTRVLIIYLDVYTYVHMYCLCHGIHMYM